MSILDQITRDVHRQAERDMRLIQDFKGLARRRGWIVEIREAADKLQAPSDGERPRPGYMSERAKLVLAAFRYYPERNLTITEIQRILEGWEHPVPSGRPEIAIRRTLDNLIEGGFVQIARKGAGRRPATYMLTPEKKELEPG